jgi:hypothetical protein
MIVWEDAHRIYNHAKEVRGIGSTWSMKELNPMDMKKEKKKAYTLWKSSRICKNMYKVIKQIMSGLGNPRNNKMISTSICYRA